MTAVKKASSAERSTYTQIFKSTLVVGASSAVGVMFSIVRNKAIALMLGPEGVGLIGLYGALVDITQSIAGMGVQSSGVRQIAEASATHDEKTIAQTYLIVSRTSLLLGIIGSVLLLVASSPLSVMTFGGYEQSTGIGLLAVAVGLRILSGAQMALLQGLRRISSIAMVNVAGAFAGTVATISLIFLFGTAGIVPSIIAVAAVTLFASWYFGRQVRLAHAEITRDAFQKESRRLLKLGFVFMISGLLTFGAAYVNRLIVLRADGMAAAGFYQAAWAIGGLYVGIVLQAMGTDFYPRLTMVSGDNAECNRLVNEQVQMSLLLAGPGVVATLTFAPIVLQILYSHAFDGATDLLRWICLGMILRVVAWPMGYIVVAKEAQATFFWTDVGAAAVHVGLAWLLVGRFGAVGAGAAFFGLYVWHSTLIYVIVRRLSGFRWSRENVRIAPVFLGASVLVFLATQSLPVWQSTSLGALILVLLSLHSLRKIAPLVHQASLPAPLKYIISKFA
jgi:enterobacterial common antigen flippase